MKKKILLLGMTVTMSMAMLAGCGTSAEDYENDINEFAKLSEVEDSDDVAQMVDDMINAIDDLDIKTSEGKDVQKAMKEMMDYTGEMMGDLDELINMEEDELEKMQKELEDLSKEAEGAVEAFKDAAGEAGVDEEILDEINLDTGL